MIHPGTVKPNSRNSIFRYLYQTNKPLTKQEIMVDLGLSLPTVTNNINQMIKESLLVQSVDEDSIVAIGRKPRVISVNSEAAFTIGIDISKHHVTFVATGLFGELKSTQVREFEFENTSSYYTQLMQFAYRFIQLSEIEFQKVIGVGISIPGVVKANPNTIVFSPELGIENEAIPKSFNKYLFPVWIESKVNAGGKYEIGLKQTQLHNLLFLSLGEYVESSFFVNNVLYNGNNGKGLQIGKSIFNMGRDQKEYDDTCTVQSFLSTKALLNGIADNLEDFMKLYNEKNPKVLERIETFIDNLAKLLVNLSYGLDCDIVIGSELSFFLVDYLNIINDKVYQITSVDMNPIRLCKYPKKSSAIGITYHFIQDFIEQV
ncbi:MAG: ROK family protein [Pleomorphochaeta sp.]